MNEKSVVIIVASFHQRRQIQIRTQSLWIRGAWSFLINLIYQFYNSLYVKFNKCYAP
jgi:hypothetical protein